MTSKNRSFPSATIQSNSHLLRNNICRLESPKIMAEVSGYLRNVAVGEILGLIGVLDSHPKIKGTPTIHRGAAAFQQCAGMRDNHFSHVAPSNLMINGAKITTLFTSRTGKAVVERIFGMGVMAPDNWAELNTYSIMPAEQNRADSLSERYSTGFGLVAALESTAALAAHDGKWDGTGKHQHNRTSLDDYVRHFYYKGWKPAATQAYEKALTHLSGQLAASDDSPNEDRSARLRQRIEIVDTQLALLESDSINLSETTRNILIATEAETWK